MIRPSGANSSSTPSERTTTLTSNGVSTAAMASGRHFVFSDTIHSAKG